MVQFEIHNATPHTRIIQKAVDSLEKGGSIIYPTDTLYGVGCSIYKKSTIDRLYKIKGKSKFSPMSIICNSIQQISEYAHVSNSAFRILKRCLPGPFTIVLEARHGIAKLMLSRQKEVGVRIPDNPVCQMLVESLGHPILNTSLDLYHEGYAPEDEALTQKFMDFADIMLDAGPLDDAAESTVVKIRRDEVEVIREGKGDLDLLYY